MAAPISMNAALNTPLTNGGGVTSPLRGNNTSGKRFIQLYGETPSQFSHRAQIRISVVKAMLRAKCPHLATLSAE
jgi:hypothetical protein